MHSLTDAVRTRIHTALRDRSVTGALAFIEAVVAQRTYPLGDAAVTDPTMESRVAEHVLRLIEESSAGEPALDRAAGQLVDDPALLAAFFQNLDLLPVAGSDAVEAIPRVIMAALQRLAETALDP